jgi:hypothetical protein
MGSKETLINTQRYETIHGPKYINLHNADISKLQVNVDVLLLSAFKDGYDYRIPRTVFNALYNNLDIKIDEIFYSCEYDFRNQLSSWISRELNNQKFKRIACVEIFDIYDKSLDYSEIIKNLFSLIILLDSLDVKIESIAFPLLGTGIQRIEPYEIIPIIIKNIEKLFLKLPSLKNIYIVEFDTPKCKDFSDNLNDYFQRSSIDIYKINRSDKQIGSSIDTLLEKLYIIKEKDFIHEQNETLTTLINKLEESGLEIFFFGILIRRITEIIVMDLLKISELRDTPLPGTNKIIRDLNNGIQHISGKEFRIAGKYKLPPWVKGYLEFCRIFGNEYTHEKDPQNISFDYYKTKIDSITIMNTVNILIGLIDFWINYNTLVKDEPTNA